ncbi:MAG: hypothetical protein PHY08_02965 [Candidatus Cloacimonetes bacterium]|nr:hypothetical protein [Candidatus Cloacimonadota bacterium]
MKKTIYILLFFIILASLFVIINYKYVSKSITKNFTDNEPDLPKTNSIKLDNIQSILLDIYSENFDIEYQPFVSYEILGIDDDKVYLRYYLWISINEIDNDLKSYNQYSFPIKLVFDKEYNPDYEEQTIYLVNEIPKKEKLVRYFFPKFDLFDIEELQNNFPVEIRRDILYSPFEERQNKIIKLHENNFWQAKEYYGIKA